MEAEPSFGKAANTSGSQTNPITGEAANTTRGAIPVDKNNFQPRVGIAYELTPKTVLRSSFGIFFDTYGNNYAQTHQGNRGNWPFAFPQTVSGINAEVPTFFLENPFPGPAEGSAVPLGCQQCLNVWKATSRTPYVEQWTFSLQRQLTQSLLLEAAYFGSHALKQSGQIIDNTASFAAPGPIQERQLRPEFPAFISNGTNSFPAWYNGLTLKAEKRFSRGSSFLLSYTWSKNLNVLGLLCQWRIGRAAVFQPKPGLTAAITRVWLGTTFPTG